MTTPPANWPPRAIGSAPVVVAAAAPGEDPPFVMKTYRGRTQGEAAGALNLDAAVFGDHGYIVTAQSWAPGGRTAAASFFVLLGVLCLVAGLFFIPLWAVAIVCLVIGLVSGKGAGELTVTWTKR